MALFGSIPMPSTDYASNLADIPMDLQKMKLMKAKAEEAYGSAAKSNMLANLLKEGTSGTGGDLNKALLLSSALGFTVPPPVNGVYHTAFGDFKVGPSDVEKEAGKTDIERAKKLREDYTTTRNTYLLYKDLQNLLEKNPSLTGFGPNVKRGLGLSSNPDLASFHEISTKLQAALAKLGGQRGGQAVLNWAKSAKPSAGNKGIYNMGMIKSALKNLKREYQNVNREYQSIRGESLPGLDEEEAGAAPASSQSVPTGQGPAQSVGEADIVMMQRPDGKVVRVHKSNVQKAISEYKFKPVQ